MKNRKQKRNIKSSNDHAIRKKVISPKLNLLRPANTNVEKKTMITENKIKSIPKLLEQNLAQTKIVTEFEARTSEEKTNLQLTPTKKIKIMKFKEIQRNYLNKFDNDNLGLSKRSDSQRSASWGKLKDSQSLRKLSVYRGDSQTERKEKPMRYEKFAFRSEKYLRLSSQAKTLNNEDYEKTIKDLNSDIDYYKQMYFKSIKALTKIEKMMDMERNKFETEKKVYEEQIKRLKHRIDFKKPNIGHLYSYKDFPSQKLIPSTLILERNDENYSQMDHKSFDKEKGEKIVQEYLNIDEEESQSSQENFSSSLSIESK